MDGQLHLPIRLPETCPRSETQVHPRAEPFEDGRFLCPVCGHRVYSQDGKFVRHS